MKKTLPLLVVSLLILTGCARTYVMTLSNGDRIRTKGKPRLVKSFYYYKDPSGQETRPIFSGHVREIAPASMASGDPNSAFKSAR